MAKPDPATLAALRAVVEQDPNNSALRLDLARLLLDADEPSAALEQCGRVIVTDPNAEALAVAADVADSLGDSDRAGAFRRMEAALRLQDVQRSFADAGGNVPVVLNVIAGGKDAGDGVEVEAPVLRLADVGGMETVKRRLQISFLGPLRNPAVLRAFGKSLRGGLLLYGPPGCGKTFLARAVAGEIGARFISVGLHEVLDMWLGESQRKLHAIFEQARRAAPCVLFFDEVDAIGRKRSEARSSGTRDVVAQLLAELDGFGSDNEGVFVLAATNHPWDVDAALRRPGRFDRTIFVSPPDRAAREAILGYHLRGKPTDDIDTAALAGQTHLCSGADLAHLCETAIEYAVEDSIAVGAPRPINMADFERAKSEVTASTREWLMLSRNYAQFANQAGLYDDLARFLREQQLG